MLRAVIATRCANWSIVNSIVAEDYTVDCYGTDRYGSNRNNCVERFVATSVKLASRSGRRGRNRQGACDGGEIRRKLGPVRVAAHRQGADEESQPRHRGEVLAPHVPGCRG